MNKCIYFRTNNLLQLLVYDTFIISGWTYSFNALLRSLTLSDYKNMVHVACKFNNLEAYRKVLEKFLEVHCNHKVFTTIFEIEPLC